MTKTNLTKADERRLNAACSHACANVQIPIMATTALWNLGRAAMARGADDGALAAELAAHVEAIRVK